MSKVKRYFTECGYGCSHGSYEHPEGQWVDYEDYARLHSQFANSEQENARLKAEVERLRKAGDAMHRAIKVSDPILDWKIELWNAAKEGKQS